MRMLLLIAAAMILAAPWSFAEQEMPLIKKDCKICHTVSKNGTRVALRLPPIEICMDCHPERQAPAEHVVGVRPTMKVKSLPLYGGNVTCTTCHEPHGLTGKVKMLRAEPSKICGYCHVK